MSRSRRNSPFSHYARFAALSIFRARYGMHENKLNDLIMSRAKSREQQVIEKFQLWKSPRLVRAVSAAIKDLENRAHLNAVDSLARIYSKMSRDGRNMYEFEKLRERLSNQSLDFILRDLRKRRLDAFERQQRLKIDEMASHFEATASTKNDHAKSKITIYNAPSAPAIPDKDERGRDEIRKRLSIKYRVLGWTDRHEIDEVFSELYASAPWLAEPIQWLWECQLLNLDGERKKVGFSPMLLVGPPGCGKTHLAHMLGDIVGLKTARIDMSARSAAFDIAGIEYAWRSSAPGIPVRTLSSSDHANPLIVLDEIDKAGTSNIGGDPVEALLPLLQRDMARGFVCPFLQGPIDLSWISWIATANDIDRVPAPLKDRMKIFTVEAPRGEGLRQVVAASLRPVGADQDVIEEVCLRIESGAMSLRAIGRLKNEFTVISRRPVLH